MIGVLTVEPADGSKRYCYKDTVDNLLLRAKQIDHKNNSYAIFVNLTNHEINYISNNDALDIPMSGKALRLTTEEKIVSYTGGIKLILREFSFKDQLPEQIKGVWYIVSFKVTLKIKRSDFVTPIPMKENHVVTSCNGFFKI